MNTGYFSIFSVSFHTTRSRFHSCGLNYPIVITAVNLHYNTGFYSAENTVIESRKASETSPEAFDMSKHLSAPSHSLITVY